MAQPLQEKKRSFPGTQGAISSKKVKDLYIVKRPASDNKLLKLISEGRYVLMHGHRMCGKSTRMFHLIENNTGLFRGLWVTIQELTCGSLEAPAADDVNAFWRSMLRRLHENYKDLFPTEPEESYTADQCKTMLLKVCQAAVRVYIFQILMQSTQHPRPLVLFFDELDLLVAASPAVKLDFLNMLRAIRHREEQRAKPFVLAVVGIGSYEVLKLADTVIARRDGSGDVDPALGKARVVSPFNVSDDFKEQHFQLEELAAVLQEYMTEHEIVLPAHFTEDLFASTHGHPGLTMMAMREYHENAVVNCVRNFGSKEPPSWDSFCYQHFWATMLAHRSLKTAVGAVTSSQVCCSFIEKRGLLSLSDSFELDKHDPNSTDESAIRWMLVHGIIRHDEANSKLGVWTCPLIRMHVLSVLNAGLIETPPITPTVEEGPNKHCIRMAELLKLLIPRISTKLLRQDLARNKTSNAPHEYAYQCELYSLLSWAFTRPVIDRNPQVIPEAKELGGRGRIDLVAINHGVYAIEIGANMSASVHDEHYERICRYMEFLGKAYSHLRVFGVLLNFTTNEPQCDYFPRNERADISLLNVHVWLDDPAKNVYYIYDDPAAATTSEAEQGAPDTVAATEEAFAQRLNQLSLNEGKAVKNKHLAGVAKPRGTPLRAKFSARDIAAARMHVPRVLDFSDTSFELESFLRDEAKIKVDNVKKYLPLLQQNEVDTEEVLMRATDQKLKEWGVSAGGDRERILIAIEKRTGKH